MSGTTHAPQAAARRVVAIDLGAESCRVSLVQWDGHCASLETVHRSRNAPVERDGHLYWDLAHIRAGVQEGLALCAKKARGPIDSIGIDGWAVDYVWLDSHSLPMRDPFCYRDQRTERGQPELWKKISPERIYALTGIQMLRFNTLYQLYADRLDGRACGERWLNIPEYLLHSLGGDAVAEYTNATHTQMVEAGSMRWCKEIFDAAQLDADLAPRIVPPGTTIGALRGPLAELPQYYATKLIAPACHDTGSAVAGIAADGDDWAFISSGTWSLVGTVLPKACTSQAAYRQNFSNEGGLGGRSRFLKNVNGMWLLEECLRWWREKGVEWDLARLIDACRKLDAPGEFLDVDDPELLLSGRMPERINSVLRRHGFAELDTDATIAPQFANLIFHSLARRYAEILRLVTQVTGKIIRRIFVVGGGSRNEYLNELIRNQCGMQVIRGPVESSTIGNAAVQLAALDDGIDSSWGVRAEAVAGWSRELLEPVRVKART
jgi:rhamnulokinase